ncbi:MAG: gamma-glutamylcyclotransferase [Aliarcobacter skirrowii]|nr:gamma-glutamylcyclotransferase [Aliarcobacter skirrowii]MDD2508894.1 gamma-glutamylcyclotransferase [Aliarcobacter skirrowii]MDD3497466.1 gamma-glutamylcyclotransferase [Aliarcobacter skirrowii]
MDKFCMISSELGSYPILYNNVSNLGKKVYGEIYSVSYDKFEELDSYEDVPNLYKRIEIIVQTDEKKLVNAFVYLSSDEINLTKEHNFLSSWNQIDIFQYAISKNKVIEFILHSKCPDAKFVQHIYLNNKKYSLWEISKIDIEMLDIYLNTKLNKKIKSIIFQNEEIEVLTLQKL